MGKGIREAVRAQELKPVSLSELIHHHVRVAIETAVQEELRRTAISQGMRTLSEEAIDLVSEDVTTISEVIRSIYIL